MTRERRNGLLVAAALAVLGVVGCGENPVPERPTYSRDIKPLMEAHCTRCHGAGGTLNADPDATPVMMGMQKPTASDFTRLDDNGAIFGLLHYTPGGGAALKLFITTLPMPPPPAPPLSDWELTLLYRWAAETPPLP